MKNLITAFVLFTLTVGTSTAWAAPAKCGANENWDKALGKCVSNTPAPAKLAPGSLAGIRLSNFGTPAEAPPAPAPAQTKKKNAYY